MTFCRKITGVATPWNIAHLGVDQHACITLSMSFVASAAALDRGARTARLGQELRSAPSIPSSVTALAYLWA